MPLYHYQALDSKGKKLKGFIEAFDEKDAKLKLKDQGVFLTKLSTKAPRASASDIKGDDLVNITALLSQLVSSGIPLYESLIAVEEQYRSAKFHRVLLSLAEQVKGGAKLSQAMRSFPGSFDSLYTSMLDAGESAGALDEVLKKLSELLAKKMKLKREINTALVYPGILAVFALVVIGVLLGFVIPSIEGIFEGKTLNGFTQFVINVSHIARNYWWVYVPLVVGLGALSFWQIRQPKVQDWVKRKLIALPFIGKVVVESALSRFCRTMATLLAGGVTMIEALRLSRATLTNPVLQEEFARAEGKITEGKRLSQELFRSKVIPPLVPRMLAIGEETGHMSVMLNKVADLYEEELEKTLKRTLSLLQPVILIGMGIIVGLVMIAILLPLTDLSSLS
ncbi:MAG: type II secretion system F family protein [Chlamydiia bacterium]|nr:type II secretion system F family protein [Chlamydiia bacterium]